MKKKKKRKSISAFSTLLRLLGDVTVTATWLSLVISKNLKFRGRTNRSRHYIRTNFSHVLNQKHLYFPFQLKKKTKKSLLSFFFFLFFLKILYLFSSLLFLHCQPFFPFLLRPTRANPTSID